MGDSGTIFAVGLVLGFLVLMAIAGWRMITGSAGWVRTLTFLGIVALAIGVAVVGMVTVEDAQKTASEAPAGGSAAPTEAAPYAPGPVVTAPAEEKSSELPKMAEPPEPAGSGGPPPSVPESSVVGEASPEPAPGPSPAPAPEAAPEPRSAEAPPSPATEEPDTGGTRGLSETPPGSTPPGEDREEGTSRGLSGISPPAPATPAPTDAAANTDWDVVPVFYGTDRGREDKPTRIDYGNERGRRLELGRAMVTVPKSHTSPLIERPWSITIPILDITVGESEDPKTHFTMKEVKALTRDEFLDLVRARLASSQQYKKHALIFVHGFNTTFDYAVYRTAQIAYDLKFDGASFSYSWPSGGGLTSYTFDRERSGQSVRFLKEYIELVLDQTGAEAVSVVAHSMGNQPMLQVLKDLKAARPSGVVFNQIILAAPDVDRDSFGDIAREIQGLAKNITLYAAENDTALAASRRVNGGPRAGDIPASGPLIVPGVDTLDVTSVSTDSLGINHSGYAENNQLLKDIELLVSTGAAPGVRMPTLIEVPLGDGKYWRFPKAP